MISLIPIASLGSCKETSCRRWEAVWLAPSPAYGRAIKAQGALDFSPPESCLPADCGQISSLPSVTPLLFMRVSSATWFNTNKEEVQSCVCSLMNGFFCACLQKCKILHRDTTSVSNPSSELRRFYGVNSNWICSIVARVFDWWWWGLPVKKRAQKYLTCHGSGSRSPDGIWQKPQCKKSLLTYKAVKFLKARVEI